ncbi:MAG: hypothetical protein NVV73_15260 [Cellvibrionaceae bacterium]|nr:hypothetical protein [Cellvibrionaceae bacterium]
MIRIKGILTTVSFTAGARQRILLVCVLALVWLADGAYAEDAGQRIFRHILVDEMESIGQVNDIAQDALGFMWFAGSNGLARYDGYELRIYRHDPLAADSLPNNTVNDLLVAANGDLWIGSRAGCTGTMPGAIISSPSPIPVTPPNARPSVT